MALRKGVSVPLSEDEQRILHEIERSFYEHDPAFAREVESSGLTRNAGRNAKLSALGFVGGLVLILASFASSLLLGALGFLIMLGCAFTFAVSVRQLGQSLNRPMVGASLRGRGASLGDSGKRLRERFKRDDTD